MAFRGVLLAALFCTLAAGAGRAQPAPPDPDWPCQQRLVPELRAGSYWNGPAVPAGDYTWRDDPKLTALIETVVSRDTPDAQAASDLAAYLKALPQPRRAAAAPRLFGAILDETNDQRSQVIQRIEQLSRRQRNLSDTIDGISRQVDAIPATATGADATRRADLAGQRDFNIRTFQEAQHTVRYACEVPGAFDRRLGLFARTLQGR